MEKKPCTRRELLKRWRHIEDEDANADIAGSDSAMPAILLKLKEEWFLDTFNFLTCLPKEKHIWCGYWDLMGPLLETFYNYFKNDNSQSPLKLLWARISEELQQCTQCICQHHQAQELYLAEYEWSTVGPLLGVLQRLDEERVTQHLKKINTRIALGDYIPAHDDGEVVSVMFEVLMFPVLLDDQSLVAEFHVFIEAIDDVHELAFAGDQQYPGVYALLFFKSAKVRSIGRRLAGNMGKLRIAADLEPLQPLLKKCIGFLETEGLPSVLEGSRARIQLDGTSVWHGMNALLGFLESSAFEEGILEKYPIFLSVILNHISDESLEFLHAVKCLRRLFEMLGCKLWFRSTLSPSVMRNTLLGHCFHTRMEKSHKEIFDLFQPFLQSLEALEDGEHQEQRRHFIYFLLHQVTVSSNFSNLMKKKACQIALLIVHRGYKINPPSPPFECAHMWGPSVVSSLRDSSLHSSLRQPAFDLVQTIIVSDAAALTKSVLTSHTSQSLHNSDFVNLEDENAEDDTLFAYDAEANMTSWKEFIEQNNIAAQGYRDWMCIPMLWLDVLGDLNPLDLPISFSKAVFWARSRFSLVEPESSAEMLATLTDWLSSSVVEISASLRWKIPTGSDDGGRGKESENSIKLSGKVVPLVKTFKRLTAHFIVQMDRVEIWKQWTWETLMGESLMLLLLDPNDSVRRTGKCILEQVSNARGLASGLQFLCSRGSSLPALFLGLKHAIKLVQADSCLTNFQALHNFFFILCKILKEESQSFGGNPLGDSRKSAFPSEGGFLKQPAFGSLIASDDEKESWEKFNYLLSETAWPIIERCMREGKAFIDKKHSQMTCVRVLEILPAVIEKICSCFRKFSGNSTILDTVFDFKWLNYLVMWGRSSIAVVVRYWKQALLSLINFLQRSWIEKSSEDIKAISSILSSEGVAMDDIAKHVKSLSVALSNHALSELHETKKKLEVPKSGSWPLEQDLSISQMQPPLFEDADVQILSPGEVYNHDKTNVIYLSDDEMEKKISPSETNHSDDKSEGGKIDESFLVLDFQKEVSKSSTSHSIASASNMMEGIQKKIDGETSSIDSQQGPLAGEKMILASNMKEISINTASKQPNQTSLETTYSTGSHSLDKVPEKSERPIKELVRTSGSDPLEQALESGRRLQFSATKSIVPVLKRKVVQLNMPMQYKSGYSHRLEVAVNRFKPPNLDDWYRPILEIDYFATVGLSSSTDDASQSSNILKEVPVVFQSPDQYVEIFRPLVLEEFKAQLRSSFAEMASLEDMSCGFLSILSVERVDNFHVLRCTHDDNVAGTSTSCSENDLVLLTRQPLKHSTHEVHLVGKVERREKDNKGRLNILFIRFNLQAGSSRLNRARKLLAERSKWYLGRIMSITPQLREFQALSSVKYAPMLPVILKPCRQTRGSEDFQELNLNMLSQPLQRILMSSFNDGQLKAISDSIGSSDPNKEFDLSLIQGPPGTGKTRTIVAIVSSLLALPSERQTESRIHPRESMGSGSQSVMKPKSSVSQSAAIARAWQDAALARQLNEDDKNSFTSNGRSTRGRILICAQSNAAVDELVSRISSEGLYGIDGKMYKPYLVRVGNAKTIHPNSLPFYIDTLVDNRLAEERTDANDSGIFCGGDSSSVLRSNLEKLVDDIRFYEAKRASLGDKNSDMKSSSSVKVPQGDDGDKEMSDEEIRATLEKLRKQKNDICRTLASTQVRERRANDQMRARKYNLRKCILKEAEIVVTTLSGCGGDLYGVCSESLSSRKFGASSESSLFGAVVIDEAAQALEPATLIPLQLLRSKGTKCIMVGDPKQLPATVLSNVASKYQFQCSMFERLQKAGYPVTMLTKQYRMHPDISQFPSMHFYENKLLNGDQMSCKSAPFHETRGLGPYVFFDVTDGQEIHGKGSGALSLYNEREADAAVEILRFFRNRYPSEFSVGRIGIITPYKYQLRVLRSRFSSAFGPSSTADIEFNTVDGFQGREVDILILSAVRASNKQTTAAGMTSSIGFVADVRRMNVALTRAKVSLWILGNSRTLQTNHNWAALVNNAKERNLVISCKKPYMTIFQSTVQQTYCPKNSGRITGELVKDSKQRFRQKMPDPKESERIQKRDAQKNFQNTSKFSKKVEVMKNKDGRTSRVCAQGDVASAVVSDHDVRSSKSVKSDDNIRKHGEHVHDGLKNMEPELHLSEGKATDQSKQRIKDCKTKDRGDGHKILGGSKVASKDNRRHRIMKAPVSCFEENRTKDSMDDCGTNIQVQKPSTSIAKRKQREAVDALLSSALISSKKTETSGKSLLAKRSTTSRTSLIGGIKPPKAKRVARGSLTPEGDSEQMPT